MATLVRRLLESVKRILPDFTRLSSLLATLGRVLRTRYLRMAQLVENHFCVYNLLMGK